MRTVHNRVTGGAHGAPYIYKPLSLNNVLEMCFFAGCSEMFICKACDIMRNEAYFCVRRNDE